VDAVVNAAMCGGDRRVILTVEACSMETTSDLTLLTLPTAPAAPPPIKYKYLLDDERELFAQLSCPPPRPPRTVFDVK